MNIKSIAKKLKTVAPTIATVLGSPAAGLLTKTALDSLTKNMNIPETSDSNEIISAIESVDIQKVKKAEDDFKLKMREMNIKLEDIHAQDRANARKFYSINRDRFTPLLAWTIVIAYFATIGGMLYMLFNEPNPNQHLTTFLSFILGHISGLVNSPVNFYWGSSKKEHDRNSNGR